MTASSARAGIVCVLLATPLLPSYVSAAGTGSGSAATPDAAASVMSLGSLTGDLTYTPVDPCRIVDTRVAGSAIPANGSTSFKAVNSASFSSQGGSSSDCGTLGVAASAVALNVTVVNPSSAGYATIYPFGGAQPLSASLTYAKSAVISNGAIMKIPNPQQASDFTIYSFALAHYVVDIVGYFAPPVATALNCVGTFTQNTSIAAGATFDMPIPACPAGYSLVGAGCRTPGFADADWAINGLYRTFAGATLGAYCSGKNKTAGNISVQGTANCCRVPGR